MIFLHVLNEFVFVYTRQKAAVNLSARFTRYHVCLIAGFENCQRRSVDQH